jgi:hypothetical protein
MTRDSKVVGREHRVGSLAQLQQLLDKYCNGENFLFRGHRESKDLLPRIAEVQLKSGDDIVSVEGRMLADFKRYASPYLEVTPENDWDWLALAQHHGMPTRLLDWTSNPLAALWFATSRPAVNGEDASVWILEHDGGDVVSPDTTTSPWNIDTLGTRVFRPSHVTRRIIAQNGWFTIHKFLAKGRFVALNHNSRYSSRLRRARIPATAFRNIRWDLDRYGLNSAAMFPDLEGIARHVEWSHTLLSDESE